VEKGKKVVLVISGGNVDSPLLGRVIWQGLSRNGRLMRFSVCLDDVPGTLTRLLSVIAGLKANVLHIYHERSGIDLSIHSSRVQLELETRGPDHILEVSRELKAAGYEIRSPSQEPFSYEPRMDTD
jgi:threonine dehydratase